MNQQQVQERQAAIDLFVAELVRLRDEAGQPSFRSMAKRSGCISHATMHDAVQGTRLPSWETVVEFAQACDSDPAELRPEWETACASVRAAGAPSQGGACEEHLVGTPEDEEPAAPAAEQPAPMASPPVVATEAAPQTPARTGMSPRVLVAAALVAGAALSLGSVATYQLITSDDAVEAPPAALSAETTPRNAVDPAATPALPCPSNTAEHRAQPPRTPGDKGAFVADVSLPDCSTQPRSSQLVKTWRLKNAGAVPWKGRSLKRIDPLQGPANCTAPEEVRIPDAMPGETVDVSVQVRTPEQDTTCFHRWMQVDGQGRYQFPSQRPYFYSFFVR